MREGVEDEAGGTFQNRYERDVVWERVGVRLHQLELGERSLVFGRVDTEPTETESEGESFHIGRIAVSDEESEPIVVDWRAPLAESFYRATGLDPMGLRRRRHFASRGQQLLGIDDELFGSATAALDRGEVQGQGALIAALEESRSGKLSDIVGTIQTEQDRDHPVRRCRVCWSCRAAREPARRSSHCTGPPYLLYSHRFPLEGPGCARRRAQPRCFLAYIEQVLPSLGEAGVEIAVLADLVDQRQDRRHATVSDVARVKGDEPHGQRASAKAVRDRQRALRQALRVGLRTADVWSSRQRTPSRSSSRPDVVRAPTTRVVATSSSCCSTSPRRLARRGPTIEVVRERIRRDPLVREALERDVAGADPGAAAARPVRLARRCCCLAPAASCPKDAASSCCTASGCSESGRRPGLDPRRRAAARRGAARCSGPRPPARATTTRSAPTATSWSTRRRTCRRCSCAMLAVGR